MPAMTSGRQSKNKTFAETAREVLCSGGWGGLWGRGWSRAQFYTTITSTRTSRLPHRTHRRLKAESSFDMLLHSSDRRFSNSAARQGIFKVPNAQAIPRIDSTRTSGMGTQASLFWGDPSGILVCTHRWEQCPRSLPLYGRPENVAASAR